MRGSSAPERNGDKLAHHPLERARSLLEEALALIDEHGGVPDLSARIQEVIDRLKALPG
jgi:hypothetical protein